MNVRFLSLITLLAVSLLSYGKTKKIKTGLWYGTFQLSETAQLPILFEINKAKPNYEITLINGLERIVLKDVQAFKDSLIIPFPAFASEFRIYVKSKTQLTGNWYNHAKKGNYFLPFSATSAVQSRYPSVNNSANVAGKWEVTFDYETDHPEKAIGVFSDGSYKCGYGGKSNNVVVGTFLTETGDYRFLEGATTTDSLYLSTFDGSHAFLFSAQLKSDTLWGEFRSGHHYRTTWFAIKNADFKIGDPDSLTYIVSEEQIKFTLPNADGGTYNYPADANKDKVTLIQILGTWCPNCLDESEYLKTLKVRHGDDLEIIAVAFETQKDLSSRIEKINSYRTNLDLNYTFLVGGSACKSCASDLFSTLNEIISFPTLLFIDKKGEVRKIHTGFSGPGTGQYYTDFVTSTDAFIKTLIEE